MFIQEQQQKLEQLSWEKGTMAQQVAELQRQVTDLLRQVASLKSQLNHTEATQKDFVELSQSLQVSPCMETLTVSCLIATPAVSPADTAGSD